MALVQTRFNFTKEFTHGISGNNYLRQEGMPSKMLGMWYSQISSAFGPSLSHLFLPFLMCLEQCHGGVKQKTTREVASKKRVYLGS